jgi:4-amino-4-deoxy-L-arabinose transferase-like glycosyltransferase
VFLHGADASRYYTSALSLSNGNGFGDLLYTVPVYPFFLSIHYKILGFHYGNEVLIVTQSILLYLTGIVAGKLADQILPYSIGWLVMLLVILNPNAIINAHLVQTESLFTLFLVIYLYALIQLIKKGGDGIIILAFFALLVSLTRPAGMYVMLAFLIPSMALRLKHISWRKLLSINLIYYSILLSGLGLWSLNNYNKHGEFFVTAHEGGVFHDQYIALLQYGKNMSILEAENNADDVFKNIVIKEEPACGDKASGFKCRKIIAKAYIKSILNEDLDVILKASVSSFINLMFSGGASNLANYYGIDNKASILSFEKSSGSMLSFSKMVKFIDSVNIKYFVALVLFWGYAITTKILLVVGLVHLFKNSNNKHLSIVVLFYVLLFAAEYLFLGQSRWRVPLEPMIMIFSALGLYSIISHYKNNINYGADSSTSSKKTNF